jgi:hypothetical protein
MKLARVFPRRTRATPDDDMAFTEPPDMFTEADEVHVSVAFTWDVPRAEKLAHAWERVAPTRIGGPGAGIVGGDFAPGLYLKPGYTITSRGCPNRCWFCAAWKRDGPGRELPIMPGWNVLDDNLLACSEGHIRAVFAMLAEQPRRAEFTGGLEAARLKPWHIDLLTGIRPASLFLAYDTPDDEEPLREAARMLTEAKLCPGHRRRCYVLIGYPSDTMHAAEARLRATVGMALTPAAMLWRDNGGRVQPEWRAFQRLWFRPAIIHATTQTA